MVSFRRGITAFGMFALFTGLAAAQVGGTAQQQLTCNTNVTVTPALRGEGYTEQTGDITISCTGGAQMTVGSVVPLVNIAVFYNTTVTSRLLPTTAPQSSNNTSEALLLIDEPGANLPGDGPAQPLTLCTTPLTGCASWVGGTLINNVAVTAPGGSVRSPNVYQGVVSGNSVTFFGVPALPPATTGTRVYRITNVRVNAQPLAGGSASGASPVQASISISGATSLSIQNSTPNVGYVSNGLTTGASSNNFNQCESKTRAVVSTLTFTENFGTAFKTRVQATSNDPYSGQGNGSAQKIPGAIYNSESNFVFPINGTQTAGLANFGTRLKATFNNIPAGTRIFVSTYNVSNASTALVPATPAVPGGSDANANVAAGYVGHARLVSSETAAGDAVSGTFPSGVPPLTDLGGGNQIAEVSITSGTGTAVWEVINTNPNTIESLKFGVYATYTSNVAQNSPLPGASTVNMSFAPTATSGVASSSLPIPRFAGDSSAAKNIMTIGICRTVLLYPYITNQAGFDTGLTIANVTQDPFTTGAQSGSCKLSYYGGTTAAPTTPPGASDTGNIAAGTVWVNTLQAIAPNFQGYMFAVCNFQYAHGFAFISDVGARNLAMGYLAVVLDDPGTGARSNDQTTAAENGGH